MPAEIAFGCSADDSQRLVTHLGTLRGESSFRTWAYRVASNTLLSIRKSRAEARAMTFDAFAHDLDEGIGPPREAPPTVEEGLLLEEIKVGCTLAMLLCLDREQRLAYVLGEIMELGHNEAAGALGIPPAAFRKRISRARSAITGLMRRKCGRFEPSNRCRCGRRVDSAVRRGRVKRNQLLFASASEQVPRFPEVLRETRALEEARRSAALFRASPTPAAKQDFARMLDTLLESSASRPPADGAPESV